MGTMYGLRCKDCGFEAELGTEQPYYVMSGAAITDKYCPKTGEIVWFSESIATSHPENISELSCVIYLRSQISFRIFSSSQVSF